MKTYDERSRDVAEKMGNLKKRRSRNRVITGISLCLTVVLIAALFLPYDKNPPSVERYARNPYYKVIKKLNQLTYRPPQYDNAAEQLYGDLSNVLGVMVPEDMMNGSAAAPGDAGGEGNTYVEVTDNQVQGVIEADIFKRSDKYLYYLSGTLLKVYEIAGEDTTEVGSFSLLGFNAQDVMEDSSDYAYVNTAEMYLSADCTTVTLVINGYSKAIGSVTVLLNLDVTDPENITQLDYVLFPGNLISSRMADCKLLLTYNYRVSSDLDYDEPETYVPSYGKPGDMTYIDPKDIICPDTARDTRYTVICQVDGKTLAVEDSKALLSYAQELYVSENAIYATHSFSEKKKVDSDVYYTQTMTKITGIGYGEKLQYWGSIDIEGNVKNQYAMDEYENILRVVTNTSYASYVEHRGELTSNVETGVRKRNVSLYCIDLNAWEVEALVGGFAPDGETAESVRFDGAAAYICTAEVITLTDPVYFFDLSDLENITYTDTGTIDGYSSSLVQLGDGFLMGIGFGDERQLKIEVYEEYQDQVVSVDAWEEQANFSPAYKSYLIDRENDLVGLAIQQWDSGDCQYLLLHFDGYELHEVLRVELEYHGIDTTRACIIGEHIYILTQGGLLVEKLI